MADILIVSPVSKTTADPNEIPVPLTVPTIAVPLFELPVSLYAITTLLELESKTTSVLKIPALSKTAEVPKLIDLSEAVTVPTLAVP